MKKVIFISQYTAYDKDHVFYEPGKDTFYQFGMGQFIASEFIKRNYPVAFETWRMDLRITHLMEKEVEGMMCRIFPSKKLRIAGKNFGEYSKEMVNAFKQQAGKPGVIFHFMPNHSLIFHWLARKVPNNLIVATHLGGANPWWKYKHERNKASLIFYLLEKYFLLRPYNHFITMSKTEADYYEKVKKPVSLMPLFGISRAHLFTIKDKTECRKKLNLPLDKKILLQVGRAWQARGFDWIMDMIDYYQKKPDYFLVFAGINKTDGYYQHLIDKGVYVTPYLHQAELPDYYNAADLLYYLPHGKMDLEFAGTSYVPLEAMACGVPVVATTFHHFPGDEVSEVSRIPRSKEDVIPMIEDLLAANISRERCREIVLRQFSWDVLIKRHWEIYNNES